MPATFLALQTLLILGDDLSRVKRRECLEWLPQLQRPDGSFGDLLGVGGRISGGEDLRFCYCAAGIRYLLRGPRAVGVEDVRDIDVGNLVAYVQSCQVSLLLCAYSMHLLMWSSPMMGDLERHLIERLTVCISDLLQWKNG